MALIKLSLVSFLLFISSFAHASVVSVAVASNFAAPMKEIIALFERQTGYKVNLSVASSGKIYAQIRHGAPYHVFFSADQQKPALLESEGVSVLGTRRTYALGQLALWSLNMDLSKDAVALLRHNQFNKLALANPKLAPYGLAAAQTLDNLGLKTHTEPKWVQGENIAQTFQFVATANADLGFVALSQLKSGKLGQKGHVWQVPASLHDPIKQDSILLKKGESHNGAKALLAFFGTEEVADIISSYGYQLPDILAQTQG